MMTGGPLKWRLPKIRYLSLFRVYVTGSTHSLYRYGTKARTTAKLNAKPSGCFSF